jgi:hypothetical protein
LLNWKKPVLVTTAEFTIEESADFNSTTVEASADELSEAETFPFIDEGVSWANELPYRPAKRADNNPHQL